LEAVALAAILTVLISSQVGSARADQPVIVSFAANCTTTTGAGNFLYLVPDISVTVLHNGFSSTNYIDEIDVEVDTGSAQSMGSGSTVYAFTQQPQSSSQFTVKTPIPPISLNQGGVASGAPAIKVRAHATVDGWSDWSSSISLPEFNFSPAIAALLVALSMLLLSTRKLRTKNFNPGPA
jgi:hypothetical protein